VTKDELAELFDQLDQQGRLRTDGRGTVYLPENDVSWEEFAELLEMTTLLCRECGPWRKKAVAIGSGHGVHVKAWAEPLCARHSEGMRVVFRLTNRRWEVAEA
jgi:hypothetical protein